MELFSILLCDILLICFIVILLLDFIANLLNIWYAKKTNNNCKEVMGNLAEFQEELKGIENRFNEKMIAGEE